MRDAAFIAKALGDIARLPAPKACLMRHVMPVLYSEWPKSSTQQVL
jgi:hypothetical protein